MRSISVIMPLYNAEKYLQESLQSVLQQTHNDFELICINDGSTDGTDSILRDFQARDGRIRVLENKARSGAAFSRNRGLKEAEGRYVIFLDGDDVFEEEMLEKAYDAMEKYDTDIVIFEYMHVPSDDIYRKRKKERTKDFYERYCCVPFCVKDFAPRDFPNWSDSPCDKLYRKSFIERNHLEFQNISSFNDVYFAKMVLYCAKRIICLNDDRVMVYARDHFEVSRISSDRDPMCAYYAMENLARVLAERNMIKDYAKYLYYAMASKFRYVLIYRRDEERNRKFYQFLHEEGIAQCIAYGKDYYGSVDCYDRYVLEKFQKDTYENGWFYQLDTYFQFYLKNNGETVYQYVRDKLRQNKRVILWGMGINGTSLLRSFNENSIRLFAVTDADSKKQGIVIEGYNIAEPDAVCKAADYILVTSQQVYQYVEEIVNGGNSIIVYVLDLLTKKDGCL